MDFNQLINEAMAAAQEGRLPDKSDAELGALLQACLRYCASNPHSRVFDPTLDLLRDEIKKRANQKIQLESDNKHDAVMGQGKKHHEEAMDKLNKLKMSIDNLGGARWIDWAILIAGGIAAIAAVAAVVIALSQGH